MAVFLLVRHGHNDMIGEKLAGRLPGVHLNHKGQAQAQRLAEAFASLPITAVYASPLERAVETAQPIADVFLKLFLRTNSFLIWKIIRCYFSRKITAFFRFHL